MHAEGQMTDYFYKNNFVLGFISVLLHHTEISRLTFQTLNLRRATMTGTEKGREEGCEWIERVSEAKLFTLTGLTSSLYNLPQCQP